MTALAFGARALVYRTVIRVGVTHAPDHGALFKALRDRREPRDAGRRDIPPAWPGEPVPAPDGYVLEPGPPGAYTRLRRIPLPNGPTVGIALGTCTRYEGAYHSPVSPGPWPEEEWEPGDLTHRRAVRLVEVALPPHRLSDPARLALAWREDLEMVGGERR